VKPAAVPAGFKGARDSCNAARHLGFQAGSIARTLRERAGRGRRDDVERKGFGRIAETARENPGELGAGALPSIGPGAVARQSEAAGITVEARL
jgi:hypothetical protein